MRDMNRPSLVFGSALFFGIALAGVAAAPAMAFPIVKNASFEATDTALNTFGVGAGWLPAGSQFFIQDWRPVGYATNSLVDPAQYDNGFAGGRSVVGFLSGSGSSLSQVVQGFTAGLSYQIQVSVNARFRTVVEPLFEIEADDTIVFGPERLAASDPFNVFSSPFTELLSSPFVAASDAVTITFGNSLLSDLNATTLLTGVSVRLFNPALVVGVPEPMSLALLLSALAMSGVVGRRSRRSADTTAQR